MRRPPRASAALVRLAAEIPGGTLGPAKWNHYYLYVILDIFSRYVVGWLLAERESAKLRR